MVRSASAMVVSVLLAMAGEAPLQRDGEYWVSTQSGALSCAAGLRVRTRGAVSVRGGTKVQPGFFLRTRVRARNEAEARRLLRQVSLQTTSRDGVASLFLATAQRPVASSELEISIPPSAPLFVDTLTGDVQVFDVAAAVFVRTGAGVIRMDRIGGEIDARTSGGEVRIGRADSGLRCFSGGGSIEIGSTGGESWFETAGGDIVVGSCGGPAHASTAGGNIRIGRTRGSVRARSGGGRIEIEEATGFVSAGNGGGSVQVGSAEGVRVESTGGSIRLRGSSGALRAASDVGSILAELIPGVRLQDSAFSTGAGDITVYIPANAALTIKALNESNMWGRIVTEFPEVQVRRVSQESRTTAEGALNGGGPVLQLTSSGGTIYLRRVRR